MTKEEFIKAHIKICSAKRKKKGNGFWKFSKRQSKIRCAKNLYKYLTKNKLPLDVLYYRHNKVGKWADKNN